MSHRIVCNKKKRRLQRMYDDRQFNFFPFNPGGNQQNPPGFPGGNQTNFPNFPGFPGGNQGFPGENQGFPNFPPPGQQTGGQNQPPGPPPNIQPTLSTTQGGPSTKAVDPGSIRGCLYRYTYMWLRGRQRFWFYPTYVGRRSVSGWRWYGYRWVYYGVDLDRVESFQCY
jgi:hypothetical protein